MLKSLSVYHMYNVHIILCINVTGFSGEIITSIIVAISLYTCISF